MQMAKVKNPFRDYVAIALFVSLFFFAGCATLERRWREAESIDTIAAYKEFIVQYPEGEFSNKARERLESLHFKRASTSDTIMAYEEFIAQYPEGKFSEKALERLDYLYFKSAATSDTISAYKYSYLRRFPNGKYAEQAKSRIARLEKLFFQKAQITNTIESYKGFLERFPKGDFSDKARSMIETLFAEKAVGNPGATNAILSRIIPRGSFIDAFIEWGVRPAVDKVIIIAGFNVSPDALTKEVMSTWFNLRNKRGSISVKKIGFIPGIHITQFFSWDTISFASEPYKVQVKIPPGWLGGCTASVQLFTDNEGIYTPISNALKTSVCK